MYYSLISDFTVRKSIDYYSRSSQGRQLGTVNTWWRSRLSLSWMHTLPPMRRTLVNLLMLSCLGAMLLNTIPTSLPKSGSRNNYFVVVCPDGGDTFFPMRVFYLESARLWNVLVANRCVNKQRVVHCTPRSSSSVVNRAVGLKRVDGGWAARPCKVQVSLSACKNHLIGHVKNTSFA